MTEPSTLDRAVRLLVMRYLIIMRTAILYRKLNETKNHISYWLLCSKSKLMTMKGIQSQKGQVAPLMKDCFLWCSEGSEEDRWSWPFFNRCHMIVNFNDQFFSPFFINTEQKHVRWKCIFKWQFFRLLHLWWFKDNQSCLLSILSLWSSPSFKTDQHFFLRFDQL